jgi:hypothetical protein
MFETPVKMQTNKKSFTEFAAATLPASVLAEKSEYCFQLKFCRERERVPFDLKFKQTSSSVLPPYSCTQGERRQSTSSCSYGSIQQKFTY